MSVRSFAEFSARLREFIAAPAAGGAGFNQLALALFALQFERVGPYRRLCQARGVTPETVTHWHEIPAIPAAAFKELELSSLDAAERTKVFHSSGTTGQSPSRHFHNAESLAIYEAPLLPWFKAHLLPEADEFFFVVLTPSPALAPHSSLVHMFETVRRELGSADALFVGNTKADGSWRVDFGAARDALERAGGMRRPVAVLGTAFSFVHLLEHLAAVNLSFALPSGSRVMETGGYKGRSRTVPKTELHALITRHLGVPGSHIVCEYGMSELSSQAYDRVIRSAECGMRNEPRTFRFPPWTRVRIVSPETGQETVEGASGLIQVWDLANVRSVMAIQTEDLGVRRCAGFELIGRAAQAELRGCSLVASWDGLARP